MSENLVKYVLLNDKERRRLIEHVKPTKDYLSYQNLNLAYGVSDGSWVLTMTYYMSQAIMRDGRNVNDIQYAVLTPLGTFSVYATEKLFSGERRISVEPTLAAHHERIRRLVDLYNDREAYKAFELELRRDDPGFSLLDLKFSETEKLERALKPRATSLTKQTLVTPRGNVRYWISRAEDESRPALVFLHGLTADHTLFEKQAEFFAPGYTILLWDCPAHGESRPYIDFTYENAATDLAAILARESITAPVLIGQSLGGYVIQAFLYRYPDAARAFISIDSCPFGLGYYSRSDMWWLRQVEWMSSCMPYETLVRSVAAQCSVTDRGRDNMLVALHRLPKAELCRLMGIGYAGFLRENRDMEIKCPVLLLVGEHDRTGKVRRYNDMWHEKTGYPLEVIPNAAHNSNIDNPEAVNAAIERFIKAI